MFSNIMDITQFIMTIIIGLYFFTQLTGISESKSGIGAESKSELERLNFMRRNHLSVRLQKKQDLQHLVKL